MFAVQASDQLASARLQQHLDLMTMGAWESGSWKPASGCSLGATMCPRHRQQGKWWVHVVGDSVARFVFAAWLSALNGTVRDAQFPRHEMSGVPLCSFAAVTNNGTKWSAGRAQCAPVYTGTCASHCEWPRSDRQADTSLVAQGQNWKLSFEDWKAPNWNNTDKQHLAGQSLLEKSNIPNVVFLTLGVWEAFTLDAYRKGNLASPYTPSGQHARHEYTVRVNRSLALATPLRDALASRGSLLVVLSTPQCLQQQRTYWRQLFGRSGGWPTAPFEELVNLGNQLSAGWARSAQSFGLPVFFLDAAKVIHTAPRMMHSPCFEHHPHGVLSDTIVAIAMTALCKMNLTRHRGGHTENWGQVNATRDY